MRRGNGRVCCQRGTRQKRVDLLNVAAAAAAHQADGPLRETDGALAGQAVLAHLAEHLATGAGDETPVVSLESALSMKIKHLSLPL